MSALDRAMSLRSQIHKGEQPNIPAPKKTVAGGLTSALGGGATGAALSTVPALTPFAAPLVGAGALLGGFEYFTS